MLHTTYKYIYGTYMYILYVFCIALYILLIIINMSFAQMQDLILLNDTVGCCSTEILQTLVVAGYVF